MNRLIALLVCAAALQACATEWGPGFSFPEGSADRGREAFDALNCRACHRIEGLDPPFQGTGAASVTLGGHTARVKTYGDLVTSIINPSHKLVRGYPADEVATQDGESLMSLAYLNDVITVQELIDLVAFLQAEYEVIPPPIRPYWEVYPGGDLGMPPARPPAP